METKHSHEDETILKHRQLSLNKHTYLGLWPSSGLPASSAAEVLAVVAAAVCAVTDTAGERDGVAGSADYKSAIRGAPQGESEKQKKNEWAR